MTEILSTGSPQDNWFCSWIAIYSGIKTNLLVLWTVPWVVLVYLELHYYLIGSASFLLRSRSSVACRISLFFFPALPSFSCFGELQILDFGLARHADAEMTGYVVTRWYRAPEVILNWMHYNQTGELHCFSYVTVLWQIPRSLCHACVKSHIIHQMFLLFIIGVPWSTALLQSYSPSCTIPKAIACGKWWKRRF